MDIQNVYNVKQMNVSEEKRGIIRRVNAPGSKSITNRALLLAALSGQICTLEDALFSDDSRYFAKALMDLGFQVDLDEEERRAVIYGNNGTIPYKEGTIYVGSAGTAARFLTAMLGFSDGTYTIEASEQMKKRPMKELFDVLTKMGAEVTYLENEGCLPVEIKGIFSHEPDIEDREEKINILLDISKSTQFLSAILMTSSMLKKDVIIDITSEKKKGSYIEITRKIMRDFGIETVFDGENYIVEYKEHDEDKKEFNYYIEPDVSAASYFYGAAMICGITVQVKGIFPDSMQGDIKFLKVLEEMGGKAISDEDGIIFTGAGNGVYNGIDVNMNDFSDQALTLAAVAAYAKTPTVIRGIGHIRGQESDRISAMVNELKKVNIRCEEQEDWVKIYPDEVKGAAIDTYDDHRVAMAFSLLGLKTPGISIKNPSCTAKTFENYFDEFEKLYEQ